VKWGAEVRHSHHLAIRGWTYCSVCLRMQQLTWDCRQASRKREKSKNRRRAGEGGGMEQEKKTRRERSAQFEERRVRQLFYYFTCVFVAEGTCLPSRCLTMIGAGYTESQTAK
jgi:hypothetical protein